MSELYSVSSKHSQLHCAHQLGLINNCCCHHISTRKGSTEISAGPATLGCTVCALACVSLDTKVNLLSMALFVLMSRVTLSPLSCDVDETAKAILKEGFVLDLATP